MRKKSKVIVTMNRMKIGQVTKSLTTHRHNDNLIFVTVFLLFFFVVTATTISQKALPVIFTYANRKSGLITISVAHLSLVW